MMWVWTEILREERGGVVCELLPLRNTELHTKENIRGGGGGRWVLTILTRVWGGKRSYGHTNTLQTARASSRTLTHRHKKQRSRISE